MSTIKADTLSTLDGTKSITTDRVTQGVARAWVNFNGTGTVAIRASYNVSSITDNGTGDYTVNFTTAMEDVNYSAVATGSRTTNVAEIIACVFIFSTTSCRVSSNDNASTQQDANHVGVAIFR